MRNRELIITNIISHFAVLKAEVGLRSKVNLQDINVHAEQFYKILLNDILELNLENINIVEQNAAVIDLADKKKRIAIQVTSNNSKRKIKETVEAFNNKEFFKDYDDLKILIIKDKTERDDVLEYDNFSFNMKDGVIDVNNITSKILDIDDVERLEKIEKWLNDGETIEYILEHLKDANFDPEFYSLYEKQIVAKFNQENGTQLKLEAKSWKRIFSKA